MRISALKLKTSLLAFYDTNIRKKLVLNDIVVIIQMFNYFTIILNTVKFAASAHETLQHLAVAKYNPACTMHNTLHIFQS